MDNLDVKDIVNLSDNDLLSYIENNSIVNNFYDYSSSLNRKNGIAGAQDKIIRKDYKFLFKEYELAIILGENVNKSNNFLSFPHLINRSNMLKTYERMTLSIYKNSKPFNIKMKYSNLDWSCHFSDYNNSRATFIYAEIACKIIRELFRIDALTVFS